MSSSITAKQSLLSSAEALSEATTDIIFVASCNIDLISYVNRMPLLGETLMGEKFNMGFGGKGANKAIACSRLGSKCAVIAKLGNDTFGKDYLENFKKNGINTENIKFTDEAATGVAPIFVDQNGQNSIVVILGANLLLSQEDIYSCENLFKSSKILVTNLEVPLKTSLAALKLAKLNNVTTIFNYAPASDIINNGLFENIDYLILNEVEATQLTKVAIKTVEDGKKASIGLLDKFPINIGVIVTLGSMGVLYTDREHRGSYHKKTIEVKVVDSTGAGDAFVGAFAHYLNHFGNNSVVKAIELACDYATLTVTRLGTQSSYPKLSEIDSKFKNS